MSAEMIFRLQTATADVILFGVPTQRIYGLVLSLFSFRAPSVVYNNNNYASASFQAVILPVQNR